MVGALRTLYGWIGDAPGVLCARDSEPFVRTPVRTSQVTDGNGASRVIDSTCSIDPTYKIN